MDFSHDNAIRASLLCSQRLKTNVDQAVNDFRQQHHAFSQTMYQIMHQSVSVEFRSKKG